MSDRRFGDRELMEKGVEVLVADPYAGGSGGQLSLSYAVTGMAG